MYRYDTDLVTNLFLCHVWRIVAFCFCVRIEPFCSGRMPLLPQCNDSDIHIAAREAFQCIRRVIVCLLFIYDKPICVPVPPSRQFWRWQRKMTGVNCHHERLRDAGYLKVILSLGIQIHFHLQKNHKLSFIGSWVDSSSTQWNFWFRSRYPWSVIRLYRHILDGLVPPREIKILV